MNLPMILSRALRIGSCVVFFSYAGGLAAVIEGFVQLAEARGTPVIKKRYEIESKGGVLSPSPPVAVVYLEGSFPEAGVRPVAQVVQEGLVFSPALLAVQTGTRVEFPNKDDTYHNVFSYSQPKRFDLGRFRGDERPVPSQVFGTAGLVTLRCDIHDHMRGLILVLDTPHFVVTGEDGRFRLEGVPPGRYTLKAWLDSRTVREHPVELGENETVSVDFR